MVGIKPENRPAPIHLENVLARVENRVVCRLVVLHARLHDGDQEA